MSVVVWDGTTLAADMQGTTCDMRVTSRKMLMSATGQTVLAWTGETAYGEQLAQWYLAEADVTAYPEFQKSDDWCRLIVADASGVRIYERTPYPLAVEDAFMAWGSGRDFAMGALAMGADARRAVEVASQFSTTCGMGVEAYDIPAPIGGTE